MRTSSLIGITLVICLRSFCLAVIYIKYYGPRNISILRNYQTISGDIIEKEDTSMTIPVRCSSSCNPPCKIAWYKDGQLVDRDNAVINITLDRRMSGVYQCEASGEEGKLKSESVHVIIQYPPGSVKITPGNHTFYTKREGKPLHDIICEADCVPECTYWWYREGYLYPYTTGNNLFATNSYYYSGSSRFRCRVSNDIRPYSNLYSRSITVEVKDGPDNVTIIPSSSEIENNPFQLLCSASCHYGCLSYVWFYNSKFMTKSTHILNFPSLSKEDSGNYLCRVADDFGWTDSAHYTVNVKYGPKNVTIQYSSSYDHLKEGQDYITFTCNADCNPECSYLFYQNGKLLNKTYKNEPVQRNMSGQYTCSAKNSVLNTHVHSHNSVDVSIKYGPENVTVQYSSWYEHLIEGHDYITLTCNADCNPECSYLFYQNGKLLNKRYINEPVHRNMSGQYTCAAKNSIVDTNRNSANFVKINITYKPTITSSKIQATITAPDLLNLTFSVDSFPPSNVTIFHETKRLTFLSHVTGQCSFNVSIESCLDRGEYRIEAVNDAGSDSFTFIPNVKCLPIIVRHSNMAHKEFRVGDLLHLTVTFMANPTAEVLWSFVPWNKNTSLEVQTQQIQNHKESTKIVLILSDTYKLGKYILELKNELGKISKKFDIQGLIMSPTAWKGKTSALRETEMNTFLLQQDKLQEEVQKLRLEGDVLRLKRNYYIVKLQLLMKEHPGVIDEVFGED